jgi:hypothetical protein
MRALILAMLVACDAGKPPPPAAPVVHNVAPPVAPDAAPVDERAAVIAAALARYDQDPTTMLDGGLVEGNAWVIVEPAPGLSVPSIAAPHTAKTLAELEREADKAGKAVGFIHVFSVEVAGTSATITYGGDIALEKARRGHKLCCCESTDTYVKKAGAWTFASRGMSMCS